MPPKTNEQSKISKQDSAYKEKPEGISSIEIQPNTDNTFFEKLHTMYQDLKGQHPQIDMIKEEFVENMKDKENKINERVLDRNTINEYFENLFKSDIFTQSYELQAPFLSVRKSTSHVTLEILEGQTNISSEKENTLKSCGRLEKQLVKLKKIEDKAVEMANMCNNNTKVPNGLRKYIMIENALEFMDNRCFYDIAKVYLFMIFQYLLK